MNSRLFLVAVTYLCCVYFQRTDGDVLTKVPGDAQVALGSTVKLECFVENLNYPPVWTHHQVGERDSRDVYVIIRQGDKIVGKMTEPYYQRFRVHENRGTGEYSLIISDVQAEDAGKYACIAKGGLGQKALAELNVIELPLMCQSNFNDSYILGENDCNHDVEHVNMSCSFRFHGNTLPKVSWTKTTVPKLIVREDTVHRTQEAGVVASKFILRADSEGINGSSYTCTVWLSGELPPESRSSCHFPRINVLSAKNITESRTITEPEEVICTPPPGFHMKGCRWIRKEVETGQTKEVANGELLNLHKRSLASGTYICVIECDINGLPCYLDALIITYEPAEKVSTSSIETSRTPITIAVSVVGSFIFTASIIAIIIIYLKIKNQTNDHPPAVQETKQSFLPKDNIEKEESPKSSTELIQKEHENSESEVTIDIPDTKKLIPGDPDLRRRQIEEKATAKMLANAARKQQMQNGDDDSLDAGDVAEGLDRHFDAGEHERAKDE